MSDESAEHAARRELREETTYDDAATFQFRYLATTKIDDWRNTSNTSVLTTFFGLEIQEEAAKKFDAADDLKGLCWATIGEISRGDYNLIEEHERLFDILCEKLPARPKLP